MILDITWYDAWQWNYLHSLRDYFNEVGTYIFHIISKPSSHALVVKDLQFLLLILAIFHHKILFAYNLIISSLLCKRGRSPTKFLFDVADLHDTLLAEAQRLRLAAMELQGEGRSSDGATQQAHIRHHFFPGQQQQPDEMQQVPDATSEASTTPPAPASA